MLHLSPTESFKLLWRGVLGGDSPNHPQERRASVSRRTLGQDAHRGKEASAKQRGFGQGGGGDQAVK
eukprot:2319803-Pleurochrysis_carterae.AAC.1